MTLRCGLGGDLLARSAAMSSDGASSKESMNLRPADSARRNSTVFAIMIVQLINDKMTRTARTTFVAAVELVTSSIGEDGTAAPTCSINSIFTIAAKRSSPPPRRMSLRVLRPVEPAAPTRGRSAPCARRETIPGARRAVSEQT